MKLTLSLEIQNRELDQDCYHFFIVNDSLYNIDSVELGGDKSILLKSIEASLLNKKGVFIIKDIDAFEKEFSSKLISKHSYISPYKWIYLAQSLKNKIQSLNLSEVLDFEEEKFELAIKNLFSD